jgi:SAM-dependent MidA family methyltransferase
MWVRGVGLLAAVSAGGAETASRTSRVSRWQNNLVDISATACWFGKFSKEYCCQGDPSTAEDCWGDGYTFNECCPNADCWADSSFTYSQCCSPDFGEGGNTACWSDVFTYDLCCKADERSGESSWANAVFRDVEFAGLYAYDDFYTDAQYGPEFGYYSTGRVLMGSGQSKGKTANEFSQFTTFPMAMAPHFGRLFCRTLVRMWLNLDRPSPFSVLEFGAGSGQLATDVRGCTEGNALGLAPKIAKEWRSALDYSIVERSPALAARQRQKGLRVVEADAQDAGACERIRREKGYPEVGAIVSNELLDAFAPVKLRYNVYQNDTRACTSWQEVRLIHVARSDYLRELLSEHLAVNAVEEVLARMAEHTRSFACEATDSTVGKLAKKLVPNPSDDDRDVCAIALIALNQLVSHSDLQLPLAAHNFRWRLRHDEDLKARFRDVVAYELEVLGPAADLLLVPKEQYKMLRRSLHATTGEGEVLEAIRTELPFIQLFEARKIGTPLTFDRCAEVKPWIDRHQLRIERAVEMYGALGYTSVEFVLRPGEESFVHLANCIMPRGYIMSIDYGATFDALAHSTAGASGGDGVVTSLMPIPPGFPDCHTDWMKCPGLVDWTSFVDFTNIRDAGEPLDWVEDFYGPQSALEQIQNATHISRGEKVVVPGYFVAQRAGLRGQQVPGWYGKEFDEHQRWQGFKLLIQRKNAPAGQAVADPSWHLDITEMPECFPLDFSDMPYAGWLWRMVNSGKDARAELHALGDTGLEEVDRRAKSSYDEAQIGVRVLDWLVASRGCSLADVESWGVWADLWGADYIRAVGEGVLRVLRGEHPPREAGECLALTAWNNWCGR